VASPSLAPHHASVGARRRAFRAFVVACGAGLLLAALPLPGLSFGLRSAAAIEDVPTLAPTPTGVLAEIRDDTGVDPGTARLTAADDDVAEFTTIGFRFDRAPAGPVYVRVRGASGSFGDWEELPVSDEGPDGGTAEAAGAAITTDPLFVGAASGYEVSLPSGAGDDAEVVTVHDRRERVAVEATPFADATAPFAIKARSSWGARPVSGLNSVTKLKLGVIHHTAGTNNYTAAQVPGILRGIQAFHMDSRGWSDAGYNFAVDKFGTIWEMRADSIAKNTVGAHAIGFNTGSVGVAVLGDYIANQAPSVAVEGAAKLLGWKLALSGVNPQGTASITAGSGSNLFAQGTVASLPAIVGHKQTSSTSCPGRIMEQLGVLRQRASVWANQSVGGAVPEGAIESARLDGNEVVITGWAKDADTTAPIDVFVATTSVWKRARADRPGNRFEVRVLAKPGPNEVCVAGLNVFAGRDTVLGCRTVVK
jgi:hypothetical protein